MNEMLLFLSGVLCVSAFIVSTTGGYARVASGIFVLFAALCATPGLTVSDARTAFGSAGAFAIGVVVTFVLWSTMLGRDAPAPAGGDDDARRPSCREKHPCRPAKKR